MVRKVAVIKGDGIGPEVVDAALSILEAVGVGPEGSADVELSQHPMGLRVYEEEGTPLTDETFEALEGSDAILLGAVMSPPEPDPEYRSGLLRLRRDLDLFANIRPCKGLPGTGALAPGMDLVIVRENTEGLYSGEERPMTGMAGAEAVRRVTCESCDRVVRKAFEMARERGFTRVTAVHKANVLPLTDGVFLEAAHEVAGEFEGAGIALDTMLVDAMAADLVRRPEEYQVIVTTNLFGDILSDLTAQLAGGLGLAPSANVGIGRALFEPVHGAAPDIAGRGIANPTGCILASAMMLDHLGFKDEGDRVRRAVLKVLEMGEHLTPDLGGNASTGQFTSQVIRVLKARPF